MKLFFKFIYLFIYFNVCPAAAAAGRYKKGKEKLFLWKCSRKLNHVSAPPRKKGGRGIKSVLIPDWSHSKGKKKNAVACAFPAPDESFFFIRRLHYRGQKPHLRFIVAAAQVPSTSCSAALQTKPCSSNPVDGIVLFALWAKSFALAVQTCLRSGFPQTHKTRLIFSEGFFFLTSHEVPVLASLLYYFSRAI